MGLGFKGLRISGFRFWEPSKSRAGGVWGLRMFQGLNFGNKAGLGLKGFSLGLQGFKFLGRGYFTIGCRNETQPSNPAEGTCSHRWQFGTQPPAYRIRPAAAAAATPF